MKGKNVENQNALSRGQNLAKHAVQQAKNLRNTTRHPQKSKGHVVTSNKTCGIYALQQQKSVGKSYNKHRNLWNTLWWPCQHYNSDSLKLGLILNHSCDLQNRSGCDQCVTTATIKICSCNVLFVYILVTPVLNLHMSNLDYICAEVDVSAVKRTKSWQCLQPVTTITRDVY